MPERMVDTPHGPARLVRHPARSAAAHLLITHGAGGGIDAADLVALADFLPRQGFAVTRVDMPWRVAGRRIAPRPPVIDECFEAVARALRTKAPLVIGGRSAGARSACRVAGRVGAVGVLALAFPLHPPGRPERSRVEELVGAGVPTLVVQGGRDPFGRPEEFPEATELVPVPGADHALRVPARVRADTVSREEAAAIVCESVLEWLVREVVGNRTA